MPGGIRSHRSGASHFLDCHASIAQAQNPGRSLGDLGVESEVFLKLRPPESELEDDHNTCGLYYEFGYGHLVHKCWSLSDACGILWRRLVQTTRKPGLFAVFL